MNVRKELAFGPASGAVAQHHRPTMWSDRGPSRAEAFYICSLKPDYMLTAEDCSGPALRDVETESF